MGRLLDARGHLTLALSVGVLGGTVFGLREAALTLYRNAMIQPNQYFLVYLATPIVGWMVLGALLLFPLGVAVGIVRGATEARSWLWLYAAASGACGTVAAVCPWVWKTHARLSEIGVHLSLLQEALMWSGAAVMVGLAAVLGGAAGAWYAARVGRPLRYATRGILVLFLVLLIPEIRFVARDWKWAARPTSTVGLTAGRHTRRPNILLISIDTLRADALGSYGDSHQLTPHLDGLARDGVLFEQTITAAPWTLPAVASLLTGLYPHHHGAGRISNGWTPLGRSPLPPGTWTLASALQKQSYQTGAVVTNPYLALHYGLGSGFDSYENITIESEAFLSFAHTTAVHLLTWADPGMLSATAARPYPNMQLTGSGITTAIGRSSSGCITWIRTRPTTVPAQQTTRACAPTWPFSTRRRPPSISRVDRPVWHGCAAARFV